MEIERETENQYYEKLSAHKVPEIAQTNLKKLPKRSNTPKYRVKQSKKSDTLYYERTEPKASTTKKKVSFDDSKNINHEPNQIMRQKTPKAEQNVVA